MFIQLGIKKITKKSTIIKSNYKNDSNDWFSNDLMLLKIFRERSWPSACKNPDDDHDDDYDDDRSSKIREMLEKIVSE